MSIKILKAKVRKKDGTLTPATLKVRTRKEVDLSQIETQTKADYGLAEELKKLSLRRSVIQ